MRFFLTMLGASSLLAASIWPALAEPVIKFGTSLQLTGPSANSGRYYRDAYQLVIDRINEGAAKHGTPGFSFKSIPQGAATSVWAALVAPADEVGGLYCEDCHVAEPTANLEVLNGIRPYALDPDTARALWAKSEEMVGERFA